MKGKTKTKFNFFATFGIGKDKDYFVDNLSMLISSGMDILSALDAISFGVKTNKMRRIISVIRDEVEAGSPIWKALDNSHIFQNHTISLIRTGEQSGRLSQNLKVVGLQDQKDRVFRDKIRSAMIYPLFVMGLTLVVGIGIAWFILPKLSLVFLQLRLDLPIITKYLITFGVFLGEYGTIVVPTFLFTLFIFIYFIFYFSKTKFIGQSALFQFPGVNRLIQEIELAKFGYLLGSLLKAGLPISQALDSLKKATTFPHYKKLFTHFEVQINDGNSFKKSFSSYSKINKLIPVPVQLLIATSEQSGKLADMLLTIGENYEVKTETTTKNITVILEPILLVIVWLGVVGVALAVILPIYNLIGGLGSGSSSQAPPPPAVTESSQKQIPVTVPIVPELSDVATTTSTTTTTSATTTIATTTSAIPEEEDNLPVLHVLPTGVGYLNVRDDSTINGEIVSRTFPGDLFPYDDKDGEWYHIIINEEEEGWVHEKYVEIIKKETQ